jgi:uncharacterized membrane protein YccC
MTQAWREWRDPLRMTLAAGAAFAVARAIPLPETYWPVLSALVVTRPSFGGTVQAGAGRMIGTLAGGLWGAGVGLLRLWHVPDVAVLMATLAPLGVLVAWRADYRTAPMAAIIVLTSGSAGHSPLLTAGLRIVEIAIGSAVGMGVSRLILPQSSRRRVETHAAELMTELGNLAAEAMAGTADETRLAAVRDEARRLLREITIAARSTGWEGGDRAGSEDFTRLLTRLNSDVMFLARMANAIRAGEASALQRSEFALAASAFRELATDLGAALREGVAIPATQTFDRSVTVLVRATADEVPDRQTQTLIHTFELLRQDMRGLVRRAA